MAIFNSYVKLPEGIYNIYIHYESVLNWKEAITIIVVDSSYWREDGIRVDTTVWQTMTRPNHLLIISDLNRK